MQVDRQMITTKPPRALFIGKRMRWPALLMQWRRIWIFSLVILEVMSTEGRELRHGSSL